MQHLNIFVHMPCHCTPALNCRLTTIGVNNWIWIRWIRAIGAPSPLSGNLWAGWSPAMLRLNELTKAANTTSWEGNPQATCGVRVFCFFDVWDHGMDASSDVKMFFAWSSQGVAFQFRWGTKARARVFMNRFFQDGELYNGHAPCQFQLHFFLGWSVFPGTKSAFTWTWWNLLLAARASKGSNDDNNERKHRNINLNKDNKEQQPNRNNTDNWQHSKISFIITH